MVASLLQGDKLLPPFWFAVIPRMMFFLSSGSLCRHCHSSLDPVRTRVPSVGLDHALGLIPGAGDAHVFSRCRPVRGAVTSPPPLRFSLSPSRCRRKALLKIQLVFPGNVLCCWIRPLHLDLLATSSGSALPAMCKELHRDRRDVSRNRESS